MTAGTRVEIKVNGQLHRLDINPNKTLLDALRDDLDLTGTKEACDGGECGSCIVLFGSKSVMSCRLPVGRAQGKEIVTIEGLAPQYFQRLNNGNVDPKALHPLQQAFIDFGTSQCGFCIPGFIMEAAALVNRNPNPSREDVVKGLARNICRCTGYVKIIDAVQYAAELMRGGRPRPRTSEGNGRWVGASPPRIDELEKVTGKANYAADLKMPGMLHAKVLRSTVHHANLISIDTSEAEQVPGVVAMVTHKDIPGDPRMPNSKPQMYLFPRDKIRFLGEALAAVAAESEDTAREALSKIRVEYEALPPVLDFLHAGDQGVPLVNPPEPNVIDSRKVVHGDVNKGFQRADAVVENIFYTPRQEHFYMEPEAGLAYLAEDGQLILKFPSHEAFEGHAFIARLLGMEHHQLRILCPEMGGNFGGREDYLCGGIIALLAMKTRRPVRLVFTREESLLGSSKWFAFKMRCKTGATRDGRLVAFESDILVDGGSWSHDPGQAVNDCVSRNAYFVTGPYRVPNVHIEVKEASTNSPRAIPIRGITSIAAALAHETQMDLLAEKLGLDPLEIRLKNALRQGDVLHTGMPLEESVGVRETLEAARSHYVRAILRAREEPPKPPRKRGVGIGLGWRAVGVGGTYKAATEVLDDGRVHVLVGAVEKGQGSMMAMLQIAAEEIDLPVEQLTITMGDTIGAPYPHITASQGTVTLVGGAVYDATHKLKQALKAAASEILEQDPEDIVIEGGRAYSSRLPESGLTFAELAAHLKERGLPLKYEGSFAFKYAPGYSEKSTQQAFDENGQGSNCDVFSFATCIAEVDVNIETGQTRVLRVVYTADSGKIIHPLSFEGQCQGGIVFGQGLALKESYVPGQTRTLKAYGLPTIRETPEQIIVESVGVDYSRGPFGAKGGGEMSDVPIVGAIVNAIANATGARLCEIPATPEKVLAAMGKR